MLSDASTDERAHVFVVGWGLEMNGAHLRPIEDAIGQPMLQIAEAGGTIQITIREIAGPALILRVAHHQFEGRFASGCGENHSSLKQPVGHWICKEGTLNVPHCRLDQSWVQKQLSEAQLAYAASDVLHLHALRERLDAMLAREGRTELAKACFEFLPTRAKLDLGGWENEDIFAHS